jgi:hypothetical protein
MPAGTKSSPGQPLTSWKEIAQYFGREVRTVQRWESEEGLPVHRHMHHQRSSVYADSEELEKWWRERGAKLSEVEREAAPAPHRKPHLLVWLGATVVVVALAMGVWLSVRGRPNPSTAAAFPTVTLDGARSHGYLGGPLVGDFNGDGQQDLVLSARGAREIYVLFGAHLPAREAVILDAADVIISGQSGRYLFATQAGDFNGDGIADLILREVLDEPESYRATGPSYILWGRREWASPLTLPEAADVTIRLAWVTDAQMGGCLSGTRPADLNSDGIDDIFLGASDYGTPGREAAGVLYVLFGRRKWPKELDPHSAADITIQGSRTGEGFGSGCAVGDFAGDGLADVLVHANEAKLWYLLGGRGRTYLFSGRAKWPKRLDAKSDFDFRVDRAEPGGAGITPVLADVNGDARADLILGRSYNQDRADFCGEVHIWLGGPGRKGIVSLDAADVVITGTEPGGRLGDAMVAKDFDADGLEDVVLLEPGRGEVHLIYGRREWKERGTLAEFAPVTLARGEAAAGATSATVGDLDADELPEIIFGYDEAGRDVESKKGRVWVLKAYLPLRIEVRPEGQPNVIIPGGVSATRVFGFSRDESDQVDPATVRQAGAAPMRHVVEDYNRDGIADLQLYFDNTKLRVTPETRRVVLTARTRSGRPVAGTDSIVVTPSGGNATKKIPAQK